MLKLGLQFYFTGQLCTIMRILDGRTPEWDNIVFVKHERDDKLMFDELKKWSFGDYTKFVVNRRKISKILKALIIILGILFLYLYIIGIYISFSYIENLDKINNRNAILINEAQHRCLDINQDYIGMNIYNTGKALVFCSENNLVIGKHR